MKFAALFTIALLLFGSSFALSCSNLSTANTIYTMDSSLSPGTGNNCFNITADNITLNCVGFSITGGGKGSGGRGIYSAANNATVKNCIVKDLDTNYYFVSTKGNTLINDSALRGITGFYFGVNSTITNSSTINTTYGYYLAGNVTILNSTSNNSDWGVFSEGNSNSFSYGNISVPVGKIALYVRAGSSNNTFFNNTLSADGSLGTCLQIDSGNYNLFYANNCTAPVWITNADVNNYFNKSDVGNAYYFLNGTPSWSVFDITSTIAPYWADRGTSLPFNATTVGGNWSQIGSDYHPFTQNLSVSNTPVNLTILTYNFTNAHAFNLTVYADDINGSSDLVQVIVNSTFGTCTYISNTSAGNRLSMFYNCTSTNQGSTMIWAMFNSSTNVSSTTNQTIAYPDHSPTSLAPTISPSSIYRSTTPITCKAGNFTDPDGDVLNSSIVYNWFVNGTIVPAEFTENLTNSSFGGTDTVICSAIQTAQNWTTSVTLMNSSGYVVTNLSFGYSTSSTSQPANAYANQSVGWFKQVTVFGGSGYCNITLDKLGIINATSIIDNLGANQTELNNFTNLNWSCNSTNSPYNITFYSTNITEVQETVAYTGLGRFTYRILLSNPNAQSTQYYFTIPVPSSSTNQKLWLCSNTTNASCTITSLYTNVPLLSSGSNQIAVLTLTLNETVVVYSFDTTSTGGGPSGGGSITIINNANQSLINQSGLAVTGFFPEAAGYLTSFADFIGSVRTLFKTPIVQGFGLWIFVLVITGGFAGYKIYKNSLDTMSTISGVVALFTFALFVGLKV